MELTTENVMAVAEDCLLTEDEMDHTKHEPKEGVPVALTEGVVASFGFHKERLEKHREDIRALLDQLPSEFKESGGSGWSFLNMSLRADGEQWGEHKHCDILLSLGIGVGLMAIQLPREAWHLFPGGVPYVVYEDVQKGVVDDAS